MPKLRVHNLSVSFDGYAAGPHQDRNSPLGVGGERLHEWIFQTRYGRAMLGQEGGDTGIDDEVLRAGDAAIGATIMGRNMFGPIRGSWGDDEWRGWWGGDPPYHHPVFVLTHYAHEPIEMAGGTTFYFITDGLQAALTQAFDAAGGLDVRLGGGAATVNQYLRAKLIDELHLAMVPTLLGRGEQLFSDVDLAAAGYTITEHKSSPAVFHVWLQRRDAAMR